MLSPQSPVLTGLELTFMSLVFSQLQVLLSHLWEKEIGGGERTEGGKNGNGKEGREKE